MVQREHPGSRGKENRIEGRRAVMEAFRSGSCVEKLLLQDGARDARLEVLRREAMNRDTVVRFVSKERLDQLSETGKHQGAIAYVAAYRYASFEEVFAKAEQKKEKPFLVLLDGIEDPHNLGAIIRTVNVCGAHGVVIPRNRAAGLTETVARTSAGALLHTPVIRVTNLADTIVSLREKGLWFVCADMDGETMYDLDLTGPIGLVIGNEGKGVGTRVKKLCDMVAGIPVAGEISSLNASVAAGVLCYEVVRQRQRRAGKGIA